MWLLSLCPLGSYWLCSGWDCFQIRGKKTVTLARGCVGSVYTDRWTGQACLYHKIVFHYTEHLHSNDHLITLLQIHILGLIPPLPTATRAGLLDLMNQHAFKERSGLFTGAYIMPHAGTCFLFVVLHSFCSQILLQPSCQISGLKQKCWVTTPGTAPGLVALWHSLLVGACSETLFLHELGKKTLQLWRRRGEVLSPAEKQALGQ